MFQDFNVFLEKDTDKKFCPKMEYTDDQKLIKELVDWDNIEKAENINNDGKAMDVIGYYKQDTPESPVKFHRVYTISSKTKENVYLQHRKDKGYDLILLRTKTDSEGANLHTPLEQTVVVIKVNGSIQETLGEGEHTPEQKRMYMELVHDMSMPIDGTLRVFAARMPEKKQKRKKKASLGKNYLFPLHSFLPHTSCAGGFLTI